MTEAPRSGARFGGYEIAEPIGHGATGTVFRARDTATGETCALKVIHAGHFGDDQRTLERYRREIAALTTISEHPGVVGVRGCGLEGLTPWIAMEHVEGETLDDVMRTGPLEPRRAARVASQLARAVQHMHAHGVVHRDLKPANVVITKQGAPRIVDFGLARHGHGHRVTSTGEILGTPAYMAPEQVTGAAGIEDGPPGPACDVYGVGALFFFALTARAPFVGADARSVMLDVVTNEVERPDRLEPEVPLALVAICLRALAKAPEERFATAGELADELDRWLAGEPIATTLPGPLQRLRRSRSGRRLAPLLLVPALVAAVAVALPLLWRVDPPAGDADGPGAGAAEDSLTRRLIELEAEQARGGAPDPTRASALSEVAAVANREGRAGLWVRAHIAAALETVLEAPAGSERAREAARWLGMTLRETDATDGPAGAHAQRVLAAAGRLVALDVLLHRVEPVVPARPEVALALARAVAAGREGLMPPEDEAAFAALHDAPGIGPDLRGRLLVRRGERLLAREDAGAIDRAIDAFVAAWREHGVVADRAAAWPDAVHRRLVARLVEAIAAAAGASSPPEREAARGGARDLLDLHVLARGAASGAELEPLHVLERPLARAEALGVAGEDALGAALLACATLDRHGASMLGPRAMRPRRESEAVAWLERRAEEELAREPHRRNPAVMLSIARLLAAASREQDVGRREAAARLALGAAEAAAAEPEPFWVEVLVGHVLETAERYEDAAEWARRAHRRDAARPEAERWPLAPLTLARATFWLHEEHPRGSEQKLARLAQARKLALEAARVQRAVDGASAGPQAWPRACGWMVGLTLNEGAGATIRQQPPHCDGDEAPPEELLELGLALRTEPELLARFHASRGVHHYFHGRVEEAIVSLREAVGSIDAFLERAEEDPDLDFEEYLLAASHHGNLADVLAHQGQDGEALPFCERSIELMERWVERSVRPDRHDLLIARLASKQAILVRLGRAEDARSVGAQIERLRHR